MTRACRGLFGRIFGHKYQPRCNYGEPTPLKLNGEGCTPEFFIAAVEASKSVTYVHDVCVRCGATTDEAQP